MIWYGLMCYGPVSYVIEQLGMKKVRRKVWYGMVLVWFWYGFGMVWYGMVLVWYGMVWYGMVWYGMEWYGMVWYGMVWYGHV